MDFAWLLPLLALMTIFAVLIFAIVSKERTEARKERDDKQPSSLAADGDPHVTAS